MVYFKYIKPEEVEEYIERGYRIERGPRGGIRAYSPDVSRAISEDAFASVLEATDESPVYRVAVDAAYFWLVRMKDADMGLSFVAQIVFGLMKSNPEGAEKLINTYWGGRENFEAWVEANIIEVKDEERIHDYQLLSDNVFEVDGKFFVFKPVVRKVFFDVVGYSYVKDDVERFVFEDGSLDDVRKMYDLCVIGFEDMLGGKNLNDVFEDGWRLIVGLSNLAKQILYSDSVEVDDERVNSLAESLMKNIPAISDDYVSFEYVVRDDINSVSGLVGSYLSRLVSVYFLFRKLGASKEEAASLAKGWEITRFWTGSHFKFFTRDIEELIVRCKGNGRPVRTDLSYGDNRRIYLGKLFFRKFADCNSFNSWRKFVQAYLRKFFGSDKISVYRGVRYREVLMGLINFIKSGEVRVGGIAESGTADEEIAEEWACGGWYIKADIPVDYVIGCWLNASEMHDVDEKEITFEKPVGGLLVELKNTKVSIPLFEDRSWVEDGNLKEWCERNGYDYDEVVNVLQFILVSGIDGILNLYRNHEDFVKGFVRDFVDIIHRFGWEDIFNAGSVNFDLDDLFAEYLKKDGFGGVSKFVDELVAKVVELKKERRFKYIKPEEVEEYRRKGYEVKEGPRGGIRAYFPGIDRKGVDDLFDVRVGASLDNFRKVADKLRHVNVSDLDDVERLVVRSFIRKCSHNFKHGHIGLGMSYAAFLVLSHPDKFSMFVNDIWGSVDGFNDWVMKNKVQVISPEFAEAVVGKLGFTNVGDEYVTFKPIIRHELPKVVDTKNLFYFVWFGIRDYLNQFNRSVEECRGVLEKAFVGADDVFDDFLSRVVGMAGLLEDILNQKGVVDVVVGGDKIDHFELLAKDRADYLKDIGYIESYYAIDSGYFSFENLFADVLVEARRYMDNYSALLLVLSYAFKKLGFSREESFSLSKGWLVARFWTDLDFVKYSHYVERLVVECRGNGRPVRVRGKAVGIPRRFFERFVSCKDLENWRRFVQAYLRKKFGDEVLVYRGIKHREVAQGLADYIINGKVRIGGVVDSTSLSKGKAINFSRDGWLLKAHVPVEYVVGCWLNAAGSMADSEKEVTIEKPPGGLVAEIESVYESDSKLFTEEVFTNPDLRDAALRVLNRGLEDLIDVYGADSGIVKEFEDKMKMVNAIFRKYEIKKVLKFFR